MPLTTEPQTCLHLVPEKKNAASRAVGFLVKGTPGSSEDSGYLRIVGNSELLNTKNKEKPSPALKLITAAGNSVLKVSCKT